MLLIGENSSMVVSDAIEVIENDSMCRVFLRHAYQYAQAHSKDPSTQLGAILVKAHTGVIGWGVNGLPPRISNKEERWTRPQKYDYIEHAERNVIYKCAERGICSTGLIMLYNLALLLLLVIRKYMNM